MEFTFPRKFCAMVVVSLVTLPLGSNADAFLRAPSAKLENVKRALIAEIGANQSDGMIKWVSNVMKPTYRALPKSDHGGLEHNAVRYLLHRFFVQQHGWYIKGLEPSDTAPAPYLKSDWVPSYLQGLLEQRLGERGIDLHEVAALAVTLEDLIGQEAANRAGQLAEIFEWPRRMSPDNFRDLMEAYLQLFSLPPVSHAPSDKEKLKDFVRGKSKTYPFPQPVLNLMDTAFENNATLTKDRDVDLEESVGVFKQFGLDYHKINDVECSRVKDKLLSLERKPGRVPLANLYKASDSIWSFVEKPDYLRSIGALDESVPNMSFVIIPNYVTSKIQCYTATALYDVCCRDECEGLMQHLEQSVASSWAEVEQILGIVEAMPSHTVTAPRELAPQMRELLSGIAEKHGGKVPIHGRLFAQWMHHAYPNECVYPFPSSTVNQTIMPTRDVLWSEKEVGAFIRENSVQIDAYEMMVRNGTCGPNGMCATSGVSSELQWSWIEELPLDDMAALGGSESDAELQHQDGNGSSAISSLTLVISVVLAISFILYSDHSDDSDTAILHTTEDASLKLQRWSTTTVKVFAILLLATLADSAIVVITCLAGVVVTIISASIREKQLKAVTADKLSA